jgi:hypothetical protein
MADSACQGEVAKRVAEAVLLCVVGGLLARGFIGAAIDIAGGDQAAVTATGLLFLIWPGVANLLAAPFGQAPVNREGLLNLAFLVGALTGGFDGAWSIHRWRREGLPAFLLDVTWGLAGSGAAVLMHLMNLGLGPHARGETERRQGAHRYPRGFSPGRGFAFTQGSVMSNTGDAGPGSDLFAHEQVHIWQGRLAGPLFWLTYLGWQAVAAPLAATVALIRRRRVGPFVQWWAYFNNPWERMAYAHANPAVRASCRPRDGADP